MGGCFNKRPRQLFFLVALVFVCGVPCFAEDGDVLWSFEAGEAIFGSPALGSDGVVYFGSRDNRVYAINSNGSEKWSFLTGDWVDASPTLSLDESALYFGSWDNKLYALDTASGTKLWEFATGNLIVASPSLDLSGNIYFGSSDGFLYSLDSDGALRWQYYIGEELDSSLAVSEDGKLYIGAFDGFLYAFDTDGNFLWSFETEATLDPDDRRIKAPPTISKNGDIYFGSGNGRLYALNPDGVELWNFNTGEAVDTGVAIAADGSLVFGSRNGSLYSLDENGLTNWESYIGDIFYSTPAIDELGRIYIGNYLGNGVSGMTALSASGELVWEYLVLNYVDTSPVLGSNGTLCFGSYDGSLYALETSEGPAKTQWNRFGGAASNRSLQNSLPNPILSSGYSSWLELHGLFGKNAEASADVDNDGVSNVVEYLVGGDPVSDSNTAAMAGVAVVDGVTYCYFEFNRNTDEPLIELRLDVSSDLVAWEVLILDGSAVFEQIVNSDPFGEGGFETVRVYIEQSSLPEKQFARLRADVL